MQGAAQQFFSFADVWFKLMVTILCFYLVRGLWGGKIMYPILLIGMVSFFGFLTALFGNPELIWFTRSLESLVLLVVVAWFAYIFRP